MTLGIFLVLVLANPLIAQTPTIPYQGELVLIQQNSLKATSPNLEPNVPLKTSTLARVWTKDEIMDLVRLNTPELEAIIKCESNFNPNAISYAGKSAGMGLAQFIPNTFARCERYFGEDLDVFNVEDNLKCADYLYKTQGTVPWASSRKCWDGLQSVGE